MTNHRKEKNINEDSHSAGLFIRKARPDESFYRTGELEVMYCLVTQQLTDGSDFVGYQYRPVVPEVLDVIPWALNQVIFHEMVSADASRFAYPEVRGGLRSIPDPWRRTEQEAFSSTPLDHWIEFSYGDSKDTYTYGLVPVDTADRIVSVEFAEELEEVLKPLTIFSKEDPIVQRLFLQMDGPKEGFPDWWSQAI